ncbi:unnamed protein product [Schistocephalus solidus]|uniref:Voltage-dependent anion-selective channel protein 2 n=1 Tax=Schistocephalus solidus TaxID=70667 RepID=A0A183TMR5_SCHSO|nr:unnamed protein product [Schistocephalus solidus]
MSLSSFGDLGKAAKDVLTKHFKTYIFNFDYKSKTENNVGIHVECSCEEYNQATAAGNLTFRLADGIFVKTTIDNNMKLTNDVEISEKIKGTKHNIVCSLFETELRELPLCCRLSCFWVTWASNSNHFSDKGYLAGAKLSVDTNGFEIKEYVYSLGYIGKGFQLHGFITNHRDIDVKFYQSRSYVDLGFKIGWDGTSKNTSLSAAVVYKPDKDTFLKARVDERGAINLACGIQVIPALLTISANTDMSTNRTASYGMCLEIEK